MSFRLQLPSYSMRAKIIVLTCTMPLLAALLVGLFALARMSDMTVDMSLSNFAGETRIVANRIQSSYAEIKNDAFISGHTPPVSGIIRAEAAGGTDTLDGSSLGLWQDRMGMIFASIMETKPNYAEISCVGVDGRERVRVSRKNGGIIRKADDALGSQKDEAYFDEALLLEKGSFLVSEDFYDEDLFGARGAVFFRTVWPVFYKNRLWGFIVIVADYEKTFQRKLAVIHPDKDLYLVNRFGDYIASIHGQHLPHLERHDAYTRRAPDFIDLLKNMDSRELSLVGEDRVSYIIKQFPNEKHEKDFIGIVMQAPKNVVLAETIKIRNYVFLLVVLVVLFCLTVAIFMSRWLTRPLKEMVLAVGRINGGTGPEFPVERRDEIGELARALRRALDTLHMEEGRAETILGNVSDGIFTLNEDKRISKANPACAQMFGCSLEALVGMDMSRIFSASGAEVLLRYMADVEKRDEVEPSAVACEIDGVRLDGRRIPLEVSFAGKLVGGKPLFVGVVRDATGHKKKEQLKDAFASAVNRQLRTPLAGLQETILSLKEYATARLDDKGKHMLARIDENCARLTLFLDDVLDIEKIASGKMVYALEVVNVCPLIYHIVESQQEVAEKVHVTLNVEAVCAKALCRIDGPRFMQALVNLLTNAIKFSPDGEIVTIRVEPEDTMLHISVIDRGCGIPADFQKHVFEKFTQSDKTIPKIAGGSGLGLNIAKTIIDAFGGSLSFQTEEGQGTTFHILLPLVESETASPPSP